MENRQPNLNLLEKDVDPKMALDAAQRLHRSGDSQFSSYAVRNMPTIRLTIAESNLVLLVFVGCIQRGPGEVR